MGIKVLLIDDDEDDFLITRDFLDDIPNKDYILEWVSEYKNAMLQIQKENHDVYLVDYHLGEKNGLQIIQESVAKGVSSPFILLTGQGDSETDDRALKAGAVDYLVKGSFSKFDLERSIRYSIEHSKNLRQIQHLNVALEKRVEERTNELANTVKKLEYTNQNLKDQVRVRKIAEAALRESQNLYRSIAKNFPNGTINVLNREMEFVFVDGRELLELGYETRDLIGKNISSVFTGEKGAYIIQQFEKVFEGQVLNFDVGWDERQYEFHTSPLPGPDEEINQILLVAENITERKKAEEEIRRALAKERELNELKSRFVTMASHEFKTPLSTILSSSSLIARYHDEAAQPKRVKHVERIKTNVKHLNRLLNDFLSLGRIEEGKIQNTPVWTNITEVCEVIKEEIQQMATNTQEIKLLVEGYKREIFVDEQLLKNILMNLLSNAVKYSPNGKDVILKLNFESNKVKILVQDHGIGIPEIEQLHLFERFFRAKNTTNIQGTGLGLNIVKKYLDLIGGEIEFESKLNEGSKFTVVLPD
ncbi:MAG: response regulator [Flammeovirgaceae bacterium]|nr:response regulator [Flammeovirgaceae bacterium]